MAFFMCNRHSASFPHPLIYTYTSNTDRSLIHDFVGQSLIETDTQSLNQSPSRATASTASLPHANKPTEPFFIVPPGFRANTFFVGMEKEMHELDRRLFDSRRRDGSACVLLHGQPGVGKTHVARQYVYKNRYKFQGGVFWINAHFIDEIYKDFWQIHQKVVAKVSPDIIHNSSENLNRNFVDEVREWFCEREEWLIIFDGVSVDRDKDVDELQRFIPDSSNSAIIYVSRSRRLETMQRLLRPYAVKISGLKEQDAQDLLFKEIGLRNPRPAQIKSAKTLAKKVGGLPLAISAIARRLADTHEPIEKFNIKSYSDDPKLGGTYHHIMEDLQKNGHIEAINFMNLLCFFGSHIPVEMIRLGLSSLASEGITIKASEEGVHPDINVTLGILMRHALIERNEPEDDDSISSGRGSFFVEPEPIDVLNLHAVIQKYWCDNLDASKQLQEWLARAVNLLTHSFREADLRIRRQPKPGRLSDYRWYLVHAKRLRGHTLDYDSKQHPLRSIRADLNSVIERIQSEIHAREPSSSHESSSQAEFQTSIFDRTSSTSSTQPSQTSLEVRKLTPLDHLDTGNLESAVVDDSPLGIAQLDYIQGRGDEVGSDVAKPSAVQTAREFPTSVSEIGTYPLGSQPSNLYSYPMQRDSSSNTIRPNSSQNRAMATTQDFLPSQLRTLPQRSESFRSTSASPLIDRDHARGLISCLPSQQPTRNIAPSSDALTYLTTLYLRHPIQQSGVGVSHVGLDEDQAHLDQQSLAIPYTYVQSSSFPVRTAGQLNNQPSATPTSMLTRPSSVVNIRGTESPLRDHSLRDPRSRRGSRTASQQSPSATVLREASPKPSDAAARTSSVNTVDRVRPVASPLQSPSAADENQRPSVFNQNSSRDRTRSRIQSVSPLPRASDQPHSSPMPPRPFLENVARTNQRYPPIAIANFGEQNYDHAFRTIPNFALQYNSSGTHAPYSDPLPVVSVPSDNTFETQDAQYAPAQNFSPYGLGIMQELGDRERVAAEEFVGVPAVSFAGPPFSMAGNLLHRRTGSTTSSQGQSWARKQHDLQQQQYGAHSQQPFFNPFALGSSPAIMDTGTRPSTDLDQEALSRERGLGQDVGQWGTPTRNSSPYTSNYSLARSGVGGNLVIPQGKRRRTLSAPERPGRGPMAEHNLWSS